MSSFLALTITSVIIQFLTERIKPLIPEHYHAESVPFVALAMGIAIAFATQIGLFSTLGIPMYPKRVDYFFTGIAYSGGSVAVNELIKLVSEMRPSNKWT